MLFSGAPHDVASKVYASISPAMRAATLATSQAAAKAEVEEAPKRATEIAKALITANATSKDKQLGNITKLQYAQILGNAKVKSALAAYGIKANEVKLYPSTIPGGITLGTKGGNIFTYLPGKTDNGFTTPDSIQPVDMTSFASVSPQLSAADTSAVGADSPADVYPEDQ